MRYFRFDMELAVILGEPTSKIATFDSGLSFKMIDQSLDISTERYPPTDPLALAVNTAAELQIHTYRKGFRTTTPSNCWPSLRSSVYKMLQPSVVALLMIMASQNEIW